MDFLRKSTTWLIMAGLVMPLSPALAQTSGQFTMVGGFAYCYEQIQHGSTIFTAGNLEGGATIVSSSQDALFPEGRNFLRSCLVFSEESTDGLSLRAPCTLTETPEDGEDTLFLVSTREQKGWTRPIAGEQAAWTCWVAQANMPILLANAPMRPNISPGAPCG